MVHIPTPPPVFCGRLTEFDDLKKALDKYKVLAIAGIDGIGKTSLAQILAEFLSAVPGYSRRLIWISCHEGWNEKDLFASLLREASTLTGNRSALNLVQDASTLVHFMEEHSLVVFIDDFHLAETPCSVELLSSALRKFRSARLILTTRERPGLPPMEQMELNELKLGGLNRQDAESLVHSLNASRHRLALSSGEISSIIPRSTGHPYSIKLFVSLLSSGAGSLQYLSGPCQEFNRTLAPFLEGTLSLLSVEEKETARLLSQIRIPVQPELLPGSAAAGIKGLAGRYLLELTPAGFVALHDLLRRHISAQLEEVDKTRLHLLAGSMLSSRENPSISELWESYHHFAAAGDLQSASEQVIRLSRLSQVLGDETGNYRHLLEDALELCGDTRKQDLLMALASLLVYLRDFNEAEKIIPLLENQELAGLIQARADYYRGNHRGAISAFEKSLPLITHPDDLAEISTSLAVCHKLLGNTKQAALFFNRALACAASPIYRARACSQYAVFLSIQGRLNTALEYYEKSEEIERRTGALGNLCVTLYNKA
ncbi:MAG: NB-ARC domain-containing protein, partial [Candidatus Wallbacteria bacterium]|nr:NB-ARC domain-containing protein [Candidatus Wallbacteria bacterium]